MEIPLLSDADAATAILRDAEAAAAAQVALVKEGMATLFAINEEGRKAMASARAAPSGGFS